MRVLIVCGGNFPGGIEKIAIYKSFVYDQAEALKRLGVNIEYFLIKGKGWLGYLKNIKKLRKLLKNKKFDIIHAHSGLSGLVLSLATTKKFIVTYHGSDINLRKTRVLSLLPILKSKHNIFVSLKLKQKVDFLNGKSSVIPCGVDLSVFNIIDKERAKKHLNIQTQKKIVLFSSSFNNSIKNYPLAQKTIQELDFDVEFLEIKNRSRQDVVYLLNIADVLLVTSFSEGSPQIVKEALACNCPIVSVNVGDIEARIKKIENCYISEPDQLKESLSKALKDNKRSNGRNFMRNLDNSIIAKQIIEVYNKVLEQK